SDRGRHLPPSLFPGPDAASRPDIAILHHPVTGFAGHSAQRVTDQVNSLIKYRKLAPPLNHFVHFELPGTAPLTITPLVVPLMAALTLKLARIHRSLLIPTITCARASGSYQPGVMSRSPLLPA